MKIRAVIFGSTGMIGKGLLLECLDSPEVSAVLVINRKAIGISHPKLMEVILPDFSDLSSKSKMFAEFNTCYFCLGVSAAGLSEAEYIRTTFDLTLSVAKTLLQANKGYTFCYVSGAGTDSTETGRMMWARVKGKTENALLAMPFHKTYMFRPGYIQPLKGLRSRTSWYNFMYTVFKPLYYLLEPFDGLVTDTESLGKAMIRIVSKSSDKRILEMKDIGVASKS